MVVRRDVVGGGRDLPSLILLVFMHNGDDLKVPRRVLRKGNSTKWVTAEEDYQGPGKRNEERRKEGGALDGRAV
ncbi:hypothetical protein L798_12555 [Zootermopsis nevadensis]|uniref:Uncharacterized protein n=1 Tax=Zootermopsis nevadensis TaxID=136037 RepID=A0A067QTT4_ZOONE|nr:hypothetical protein L798_12555 [Zootermopsis nevadensis]